MNITKKTKYQLEVDESQLKIIKDALSHNATQWFLYSTKHADRDLSNGAMINFRLVAAVRDLFNEHYEKLIDNKDS